MGTINIVAVILAAIAGMGIGALWYSPLLFANVWMKEVGLTPEELTNPTGAMIQSMVTTAITAIMLALMIAATGTKGLLSGLGLAALIWFGFVLTTQALLVFFEGRSTRLFAINSGHLLATYLAMGAILGAWQ